MRLAWLTDPHLNFLTVGQFTRFIQRILESKPEAVLIGGDIAEAPTVGPSLDTVQEALGLPVYFVLGNHDYYGGSIANVRAQMTALCRREPRLTYLSQSEWVELTPETALIGHDGWGDARTGNTRQSPVQMNDFVLIHDLMYLRPDARLSKLNALGDEAADHFRRVLPKAFKRHTSAILLTHVAPFAEAAWHAGRPSGPDWQPYFVCTAAGRALKEIMLDRPDRRLTVLCGHTHGGGEARILPNLCVLTGRGDYERPEMQILTIE